MAITSTGVGSGLDIEGIVTKLMDAEKQPITQLDVRTTQINAKISAYGSLKSALADFQAKAKALSLPTKFNAFSSTSSNPDSLKVSAFSTANTGQHSVVVKQLAAAHSLASNGFAALDSVVGSGTITIQFGSVSGGVFTADATRSAQSVNISSDQHTLNGVRDAIQSANVGVNATVVNDGSANGWRLALTSAQMGSSSVMKITVSGDADGNNADATGLSSLVFDPAAAGIKNLSQTVAGSDALLKVDGLDNIIKHTNSVSDVIKGVTLNLQKADAASPISVQVDRDTVAVTKSVQEFVDSYNALQKALTDATAYDLAKKQASVLTGDAAARNIQTQMRSIMTSVVATTANGFSNLSQVGISVNRDATLSFDTSKFTTALTSYPDDISMLFAGSGESAGFGSRIDTLVKSFNADKGSIGTRVDGLNASIALLAKRKSDLSDRLVSIEARYRKQFNSLDILMSNMRQTSTFLTQQLNALSSSVSGR